MPKTTNPLINRLEEQKALIKALCDCYDQGNEIVALSMATAVRVLVHDTHLSTSLLSKLAAKSGHFLSTNLYDPNKRIHLGLVRQINVGVHDGIGGEAKYWPLCDDRYFAMQSEHFIYVPFDKWWNEIVFKSAQSFLTRKDLILSVVNKDGGAHYDGKVEQNYDNFRKSWSGGTSLVGKYSSIVRGYDNIPTLPAIRQICYEILNSILD